ncbi:acyltransferase family protein [Pseudonocardia adelaidensis]|uniref:Acyltransferase n=1 Tax=Pseudonocardia adelaidensis TaxID=648754 RepID=A0ABP9NYU6_9PSEU
MPSLQDRFDPRRNGFDALRLLFALLVAVDHGVSAHSGGQLGIGRTGIGDFALDGFFVLSGYLVTRSWFRLESFPRFAWHRFLRIMPGFWVCLVVVAFVVAPVAAALQGMSPLQAFTGTPSAWDYVFQNAGLLIVHFDIAGILADLPKEDSFNGAVWSLAFEALCYAIVGVLGALGVLCRRAALVPAAAAVLLALTAMQVAGLPVLLNDRIIRLTLVFLLGATAYLYADRVPLRGGLVAAAAGLFLASLALFDDYRVLGAVPFAYLCLWAGTSFAWRTRTDLSYGFYIYHWPLQQLLVLTALGTAPIAVFVAVSITLALLPAAASWYLVERPVLRHKDSPLPDRLAEGLTAAFAPAPGRSRLRRP